MTLKCGRRGSNFPADLRNYARTIWPRTPKLHGDTCREVVFQLMGLVYAPIYPIKIKHRMILPGHREVCRLSSRSFKTEGPSPQNSGTPWLTYAHTVWPRPTVIGMNTYGPLGVFQQGHARFAISKGVGLQHPNFLESLYICIHTVLHTATKCRSHMIKLENREISGSTTPSNRPNIFWQLPTRDLFAAANPFLLADLKLPTDLRLSSLSTATFARHLKAHACSASEFF